jgi:putative heme transporter
MSRAALTRRGLLLLVTAISLYLLAPALLEVFGAFDELDEISPLWFPAMIAPQIGSYACIWGIQKLAVRADHWGPVVTSQLASNAFGRVVPGGVAASGAVQYAMLVRTGVPAGAAASGMTASALLLFGTLLALPLLATPAIIGGVAVDPHLTKAALAGAVLFILMVAVGAACVLSDRPLVLLGRAAQATWNRLRRQREPLTGLPERLLHERDVVLGVLGRQWWEALLLAAGRWVLDYLTLIAALYAVGASPRASLVLLAFCAAQLLGTLPLTPGGLGFVEAGLTGTLALAGVGGGAAVVATLAYRLVSFWLPLPAGAVAAVVHRRRYGAEEVEPPPAATPVSAPGRMPSQAVAAAGPVGRFAASSSGGPFCAHHALIAPIAGPMIRFFWKFSVSLTCGSGVSGTGTSRNSQSGSQPSLGSQTSRRSAGTVSFTSWFQRSYASAIAPGSPFEPLHAPRASPKFISNRRSIHAA